MIARYFLCVILIYMVLAKGTSSQDRARRTSSQDRARLIRMGLHIGEEHFEKIIRSQLTKKRDEIISYFPKNHLPIISYSDNRSYPHFDFLMYRMSSSLNVTHILSTISAVNKKLKTNLSMHIFDGLISCIECDKSQDVVLRNNISYKLGSMNTTKLVFFQYLVISSNKNMTLDIGSMQVQIPFSKGLHFVNSESNLTHSKYILGNKEIPVGTIKIPNKLCSIMCGTRNDGECADIQSKGLVCICKNNRRNWKHFNKNLCDPRHSEVLSTKSHQITTKVPITNEKPITTNALLTSEKPITTKTPITSEKPITTKTPLTSEKLITTKTPNTSEKIITTKASITSEKPKKCKPHHKFKPRRYTHSYISTKTPIIAIMTTHFNKAKTTKVPSYSKMATTVKLLATTINTPTIKDTIKPSTKEKITQQTTMRLKTQSTADKTTSLNYEATTKSFKSSHNSLDIIPFSTTTNKPTDQETTTLMPITTKGFTERHSTHTEIRSKATSSKLSTTTTNFYDNIESNDYSYDLTGAADDTDNKPNEKINIRSETETKKKPHKQLKVPHVNEKETKMDYEHPIIHPKNTYWKEHMHPIVPDPNEDEHTKKHSIVPAETKDDSLDKKPDQTQRNHKNTANEPKSHINFKIKGSATKHATNEKVYVKVFGSILAIICCSVLVFVIAKKIRYRKHIWTNRPTAIHMQIGTSDEGEPVMHQAFL